MFSKDDCLSFTVHAMNRDREFFGKSIRGEKLKGSPNLYSCSAENSTDYER